MRQRLLESVSVLARFVSCAGLLTACHYAGQGAGLLRAPSREAEAGVVPKGTASLRWESHGELSSGRLEVALPDGRLFKGSFVQPQSGRFREDSTLPLGASWSGPWAYGRPWYGSARGGFVTDYSGQVLAHLTGPDDVRMRCELTLFDARTGLRGGAQGSCQLSTNEDIFDLVIPRSS